MNEKRTKINKTEAEDGPFLKKERKKESMCLQLSNVLSQCGAAPIKTGEGENEKLDCLFRSLKILTFSENVFGTICLSPIQHSRSLSLSLFLSFSLSFSLSLFLSPQRCFILPFFITSHTSPYFQWIHDSLKFKSGHNDKQILAQCRKQCDQIG